MYTCGSMHALMAAYTALETLTKCWCGHSVCILVNSICMMVDTFMECIQYVDDASLHVNMFVLSEAGYIEEGMH